MTNPTPPGRRRRRRATAPQGTPTAAAPERAPAVPGADGAQAGDVPGGRRDHRQRRQQHREPEPAGPRNSEPAQGTSDDVPARRATGGQERRPARDRKGAAGRREAREAGDLAGSGGFQVGTSAALRARDVNRPDDADLRAAQDEVVIVRRHWKPDEQAPRRRPR